MSQTDFTAAAELFANKRKSFRSRVPLKYKRFDSLALAVQFAVEELGADLNGINIRTENDDVSGAAIRTLYDDTAYPLERKALRQAS
ncbi:hypothetical protein [Phreatobacter sp.]|jgi:hypothetical protein|uniref:hypothetical protein n=1 Tax=Phreatobacter sp. TaxID=1966341 RepID=UPI0025FB4CEF|nr:hypothetical protein [Phreatobacter sp.]